MYEGPYPAGDGRAVYSTFGTHHSYDHGSCLSLMEARGHDELCRTPEVGGGAKAAPTASSGPGGLDRYRVPRGCMCVLEQAQPIAIGGADFVLAAASFRALQSKQKFLFVR